MNERRFDVFFYGLYMDQDLLASKGIYPTDVRIAAVFGLALRIGARAAVVPDASSTVHGVLMRVSHQDIERLYAEPNLRAYRPEPVLAREASGEAVAALCYNLLEPPAAAEHNTEYAAKLRAVATRAGLPSEYVATIH